jgi:ribosome biogenesis GTPase A
MNAARRAVEKTLAQVDVVIEVLDARLPGASANPMVTALRRHRNRPCLKVLNKADLADPAITAQWLTHYREEGQVQAVALSLKKPGDAARVPTLCQTLAPYRQSPDKPLRMLILGIPNVGKSTLMNALVGRKVAKTGDEPAVTKSQQRFDLSPSQVLFDTPGLMWPKIEQEWDGFMLAASHAIGVNAVPIEEVARFLGDTLLELWPDRITERYGLAPAALSAEGSDLLEAIGKKRGCLQKGGGLDLEKAARLFLLDYRSGALGRLSLETPDSRRARLTVLPPFAEEAVS